mgnify:CR=1 FL=1
MSRNPEKIDIHRNTESSSTVYVSIVIILVYRWLIFLFSAILCITSVSFAEYGYAVLESLAAVAVYNGAVTVYCLNNGKKFTGSLLYIDIVAITLLIFFSGGINSDLYIFFYFVLGLYGISNNLTKTMKTAAFITVLYSVTCFYINLTDPHIIYYRLIIRDLLFFMVAYVISRLNYEVRKYDEMRKKEFRLARTDKLTGLANRHYFDQKVREEAAYADATNSVLNILMFDLDNFKGFNDSYGHVFGDKLLKLFSDIIMQCVRKSDIPVRYGGEEFLIMIRDMDIVIAKSVGDRIRRQLEKQCIRLGQQMEMEKVTASCGIAQYPTHSRNIREVIEMADKALYHAKAIGKNIVVCYDEIGKDRAEIEQVQAAR